MSFQLEYPNLNFPIDELQTGVLDVPLTLDEQSNMEAKRASFHSSRVLRINAQNNTDILGETEPGGLGDSIMATRVAFEIARQYPGKDVRIDIHDALLSAGLNVPKNVQIIRIPFDCDPGDFQLNIRADYYKYSGHLVGGDRWYQFSGGVYRGILKDDRYQSRPRNFGQLDYQWFDGQIFTMFGELGIPYSRDAVKQPIIQKPENLPNYIYDYILIPDAAECEKIDNAQPYSYSIKSLLPEQWRDILQCFDRDSKVSIVIGKSHPEYCYEVSKVAQYLFSNAHIAITPTLKDLRDHLFLGHKIIGMDSGTTHFAEDVVRVSRLAGREQSLRNIFLTPYVNWQEYATTIDPILNYNNGDYQHTQETARIISSYILRNF